MLKFLEEWVLPVVIGYAAGWVFLAAAFPVP
jgi:hypothetical protein